MCLEGRVTVTCGQHRMVLDAGDSCHYDGGAPHGIENTGTSIARVLIAITPVAFEPVARLRQPEQNGGRVEVGSLT